MQLASIRRRSRPRRAAGLAGMKVALAGLLLAGVASAQPEAEQQDELPLLLAPTLMPQVAEVDVRFQSYVLDMAALTGGAGWKPYSHMPAGGGPASADAVETQLPLNLDNSRLRTLVAALAPMYLRVGGPRANTIYFQDDDNATAAGAPAGFDGVLKRRTWAGLVDFAKVVDARLMTTFAISPGVRDAAGNWTPVQAQKLLAYTRSLGGDIAAAELMQEPETDALGALPSGYDAAQYGRDMAALRAFARREAPGLLLAGPGTEDRSLASDAPPLGARSLLEASPSGVFDIFSYRYYGAASPRCPGRGKPASAAFALSEHWLAGTDRAFRFYAAMQHQYAPDKPIWVTATADADCGGSPWAGTFRDSFRYLDQLGRLARQGVRVVFHDSLTAPSSGLLDPVTLNPRPNYWAALLWQRLMGNRVLDSGRNPRGLHLYAHCLRGQSGGVALLAINPGLTSVPLATLPPPTRSYTLTARRLNDQQIELNGEPLTLERDTLPELRGADVTTGALLLPPQTITFLTVESAGNDSCRLLETRNESGPSAIARNNGH